MARKARERIYKGSVAEYMLKARKSDGFDVTAVGRRLCGGITPFGRGGKNPTLVAKLAVELYNETNNDSLVFDGLVKTNGQAVGGIIFYFTLRVRSPPPDNHLMVYQAKVFVNSRREYFNQIFRPHPNFTIRYPDENTRNQVKAALAEERSKSRKEKSLPKGSFFSFVSDLRKLPEIADMKNDTVIKLASIKWKSMSAPEKKEHCSTRSLKSEDIAGLLASRKLMMNKAKRNVQKVGKRNPSPKELSLAS